MTWQVIVNGGESILEALDLEARYQISFWDALVLQAAHAAGAEVLYSEGFSDRQAYGSVRIVNPLVNRPDPPAGSRGVRLRNSDD